MRKILEKSFNYTLYFFFVLFVLLIYMNVKEHFNLFCISICGIGILLFIFVLILNKCKKFQARRWYFIFYFFMMFFLIGQAIYLLLIKHLFLQDMHQHVFLQQTMIWFNRISIALSIVSFIFIIFYSIKDYFKKGYSLQKFDLDALKMICNAAAYLSISFLLFDYVGYHIVQHVDPINFMPLNSYSLLMGDFDVLLYGILLISGIYLLLNIILDICIEKFFLENKDKSNNIYK